MGSKLSAICFLMLFSASTSMATEAKRGPSAVEVSCVCSKYSLNAEKAFTVQVEELFTTTQAAKAHACETGKAPQIDQKVHFNCKAIAKEDMVQSADSETCPKTSSINCMPPTHNPDCERRAWIKQHCPGVGFLD